MSERVGTRKSTWRWLWAIGVAVVVALGLVLLFLLTLAADNQVLYERNYDALLMLNALVALVLLSVIGWTFIRQSQIWLAAIGQVGHDFCLGGHVAGGIDLCGVIPICVPLD